MNSCPIIIYAEVDRAPSVAEAARRLGVFKNEVRHAVERGTSVKGNYYFQYADMPPECQPLRRRKRRVPVIWEGREYPTIMAAAGGDRAKWMKIWRAIGRDRRYPGGLNTRKVPCSIPDPSPACVGG